MLSQGPRVFLPLPPCFSQLSTSVTLRPIKRQLRQARCLSGTTQQAKTVPPQFGFAFDIDGVLLRSAAPIPGAPESLTYLRNHQIPFILLTNGGGKHESERVADISKSLHLSTPLTVKNFVQSHTPFADFLQHFPHNSSGKGLAPSATVLVVGGEASKCRAVAESYGFQNVITPGDIFNAHPEIWPFSHVFRSYYRSFAKSLPRHINPTNPASSLKVDAIFVFNDPRDWALDIQLILDVLLSEAGTLGTTSAKNGDKTLPNNGFQQDGQPPLYFSNPDLLWAAEYHLPRLGQGGFQHALEGVWKQLTHGSELQSAVIGKPSSLTYSFAEKTLQSYRLDLLDRDRTTTTDPKDPPQPLPPLRKIYMVGDNPESDIMGANNYNSPQGTEWVSMLVKTGIYTEERKARYDVEARPELKAKVVTDDVRTAVDQALRDSGWNGQVS